MQFSTRSSTAAVDNGYHDIKAIVKNQLTSYRSKIEINNGCKITNDVTLLEYEGTEYVIGAGKDNIDMDKTKSLHHKLFTLNALGSAIDYAESFNLVLALPMSHFKNNKFRDEFKNYMMEPTISSIRIDGKKKVVTIKDVTVFMQGAAALYSDPQRYKNRLIGLIDWGGLTINACLFENLNPIIDTMVTINAGTIILDNKIKTAINENFFMNVQDYEIPYLMNQERYSKVISDVINEHCESVKRELKAKNWSLDTLEKLGIGGGMLRNKAYVHRHFSNMEVPEDPQYETVKGLQVIGEMIYGI